MLALMLAGLAACEHVTKVENRGYVEAESVRDELTVGKSTRSDVRRLLGSPSTISAYPPETWFYVSRSTETVGFLKPELTEQKVATIEFDEAGYVSKLENIGVDAAQEMDYVDRKTPTSGKSLGFFEQLLGNVGRFNTPRDSTQARQ
jgi:outer membrane protein assembly factor BamE (lipoprotein component of BamABCDE complex)